MLIYQISLAIFVLIGILGFVVIRSNPTWVERAVTQITLLGFLAQIAVNWLFLGSGMVYNPFAEAVLGRTSITFLVFCLVSIFCYASLLMIFYKAHEFYHE